MKTSQTTVIAINSTALFLLSYLLVFIIHQLFTIIAASIFGFHFQVDYTQIGFLVKRYDWSFDSVKVIYSTGPLISLLLAVAMISIAIRFREYDGLLKLFFLWGFVHSISLFLGSAFAGALFGEGFGHVLIWLFLPDTGKLIITLVAIFLLATIGFAITRLFLLSANTYFNTQSPAQRPSFLRAQVLFPFIIGTIILGLMRFPMSYYELARLISPLILLLPIFLNSGNFPVFFFDEEPKVIKISGSLVAAALIILLVYRVGLNFPIKF